MSEFGSDFRVQTHPYECGDCGSTVQYAAKVNHEHGHRAASVLVCDCSCVLINAPEKPPSWVANFDVEVGPHVK